MHAGVAELVDAPDSKSGSFGSVGSIPTLGTIGLKTKLATAGFFYSQTIILKGLRKLSCPIQSYMIP